MNSFFIISLDTEMRWGYHLDSNSKIAKILQKDEEKAIKNIEVFLKLFEKYSIPTTWAVVGRLFSDYYEEIIEKIILSPVEHEIAYHSFSHILFSECNDQTADNEIREGIKLARDLGITFKSFVYPKNKIGYIYLLKKYGFHIYRGANFAGKSVGKSLPTRIVNFAVSKLIPPPVEPIWKDGIWELPSSMIFYDPLFPYTLTFRTKCGIKKAIKEKKIFHIFMHPEDLLVKHNIIEELEEVLKFVSKKHKEGKIKVITMGELVSILNHKGIDHNERK